MWSDATKLPCSLEPFIPGRDSWPSCEVPHRGWVGVWRYSISMDTQRDTFHVMIYVDFMVLSAWEVKKAD